MMRALRRLRHKKHKDFSYVPSVLFVAKEIR